MSVVVVCILVGCRSLFFGYNAVVVVGPASNHSPRPSPLSQFWPRPRPHPRPRSRPTPRLALALTLALVLVPRLTLRFGLGLALTQGLTLSP